MCVTKFNINIRTEHKLSAEQKLKLLEKFRDKIERLVPKKAKVTVTTEVSHEDLLKALKENNG